MPLYSNKQPIESLGGNCILWRARFESAANELRCTIPPADVEVTSWSIGPNWDPSRNQQLLPDVQVLPDISANLQYLYTSVPSVGRSKPVNKAARAIIPQRSVFLKGRYIVSPQKDHR